MAVPKSRRSGWNRPRRTTKVNRRTRLPSQGLTNVPAPFEENRPLHRPGAKQIAGCVKKPALPLVSAPRTRNQELVYGNLQGLGNVEKALIEQSAAPVLNIDEDIACNTRPQCKRLLSHPLLDP